MNETENKMDSSQPGEFKRNLRKKKHTISLWDILSKGLLVVILLLAVGVAYLWKAQYYLDHFPQNTWINGMDCAGLKLQEVKEKIQDQVEDYVLEILTRDGEVYTVTGAQIKLQYAENFDVENLLAAQEPLLWLKQKITGEKIETVANLQYSETDMREVVRMFPFMDQTHMILPQNAYLEETDDGFVIIPEIEGTMLDEEKVFAVLKHAVETGEGRIYLEEEECYLKPSVYQDSLDLKQKADGLNALTNASVRYVVCGETYVIDRSVLKTWMKKYDNGVYDIDTAKMEAFIDMLADERDSYGLERIFTTHAGETILLHNNQYGWKVNREQSFEALKRAVSNGFQGDLELVYDQKAQGTGKNDLGDVYVEISISQQMLWCWKDGRVFVETPIVTGTESGETTATLRDGCWYIYRKATRYTIKGEILADGNPEYTEFAQYWMPFYENIGIYDKNNREDGFGGQIYLKNGSYGSVQTPLEAAKQIFAAVSVGTPVIIYE